MSIPQPEQPSFQTPLPPAPIRPLDKRALIAIDLGAESCRVSLLRWLKDEPHVQIVHRFANAPVLRDRALLWDLKHIEEELDAGLRRAAENATEGIRSIAADGWAVDYVRIGSDGSPVADPFCYRDERTLNSERAVHERISPERLRAITGVQQMRINTLYQLYADRAEIQSLPWLNLPEYILHRLGGRAISEYTNATHTQLVDTALKDWSPEIFQTLGLTPAAAAPIVQSGSVVGRVQGPLCQLAAFRNALLIAPACHDTASAIAGIPDNGDDWAYISSGTWSLVGTVLAEPENGAEAQAEDFTNLGAPGGRICFHKNVNGMWLMRQCMLEWAPDIDWMVPELIAAAEREPEPDDVLDVDDPDLLFPGNMPGRINAQLRRRGLPVLDEGADAASAMVSLIFHSLAARYAKILTSIAAITGRHFNKLYIVGGGSRNTLLNRLTGTATGLRVICGAVESSTIGNFAIQLATLENGNGDGVNVSDIAAWARQLAQAHI